MPWATASLMNGWALMSIVPPLTSAEMTPWLITVTFAAPPQTLPEPMVPFWPSMVMSRRVKFVH